MPRYYFHIKDGEDIPDTEGTELPNDEAARTEAVAASAEAIAGLGERFWNGSEWQMNVVDEGGREVVTLAFHGQMSTPASIVR